MRKTFLHVLTVFLPLLLATGCGSGTKTAVPVGTAAALLTRDSLNDQIAKFELTIDSITLTGAGGTSTPNLLSGPAEIEFTHQAARFEPLSLVHILPGTYSGATMIVSNPEVVAMVAGVPTKQTASLSSTTVSIPFSPNITIGTMPLFINFDIDLPNSVTISGSSATVAPTFSVRTSMVGTDDSNEDDSNGGFEDVHGRVSNITAPNFTIQTEAAALVFATDGNTIFRDGLSQLSDLEIGEIVEVDAVTRSDGSTLATRISLESGSNGEEVEGLISALDNPLTTISVVHQLDTSGSSSEPVTVNAAVSATTVFSVRADRLTVTAMPFDATHIGKGQRLEIDAGNNSSPFVATRIKLREQALLGTVAASPAPTSAGFTLNISSTSAFGTLSGVTSIPVTFATGANLRTTPTPGMNIRVRGLVFVNGGAYSMLAVLDDEND